MNKKGLGQGYSIKFDYMHLHTLQLKTETEYIT